MTLALWTYFFLYTCITSLPVYSKTNTDIKGVNGDKNADQEKKDARGELQPLSVNLENSRLNSRYPSDPLHPPRPYYNPPPFFSTHVEMAPHRTPPYLRPAPVVINNHRPQTYRPSIISNHSPYSTRRPLPTNQPDIIRNITFGLVYPQLHIIPSSIAKDKNTQGVISSNSIDFVGKPSEDTTVVYSDVIVIKKPFGEGGDGPASLTIFTSRNDSDNHVEVATTTELPTTTTQLTTEEATTALADETTESEIATTTIHTSEEDIADEESDPEIVSISEEVSLETASKPSSSNQLTHIKPAILTPGNSLMARPLAQRLIIAIPSAVLALGLLLLLLLV